MGDELATKVAEMTVEQALIGSVVTSAATGLIGNLMAPGSQQAPRTTPTEAPEPPPTADRKALQSEAERRAAARGGSRAETTTLFDTDLLGA